MTTISFPGLGISPFTVNSTAFTIPIGNGIQIQWYALIIVTGIILGFLYCTYRAKQNGIKFDDVLDVALYTILFGMIGARLGFVIYELDEFLVYYDSDGIWGVVKQMLNIRNGGLMFYGALIAAVPTICVVCKIKKINILKMLDSVAPAIMIGQIIGRWGNFINGEAHGRLVTEDSPLYFIRMGLNRYYENGAMVYKYGEVHPTFLYESLWNLVGFLIIHLIYKKKKFNGQIILMYLAWYGFGRMMIEPLRTDPLTFGNSGIRASVVISIVALIVGVSLLIVGFIKTHKSKKDEGEYIPTYAKISHYGENTAETAEVKTTEEKTEAVTNEEAPSAKVTTESKLDIEKKFQELLKNDEESVDNKENNNG